MANNLKKLRKQKGLTQEELAGMVFLSKGYYCQMETGKRPLNGRTIDRLAKVLGVESFMILVDSDNPDEANFAESYSALNESERRLIWDLSRNLAANHQKDDESDA